MLTCGPSSAWTAAAAPRRPSSGLSSSWCLPWGSIPSSPASPRPEPMAMVRQPLMFARLPTGARRVLFALALAGACLAFAFPVLWLILTSLRPESGVYYVHRGTEFTLGNFAEELLDDLLVPAFLNSALISTLGTFFSLLLQWS